MSDMVLTPRSAYLVKKWSPWITIRARVFSQGLQRNKRHEVANSFSPLMSLLQIVVECMGLIAQSTCLLITFHCCRVTGVVF